MSHWHPARLVPPAEYFFLEYLVLSRLVVPIVLSKLPLRRSARLLIASWLVSPRDRCTVEIVMNVYSLLWHHFRLLNQRQGILVTPLGREIESLLVWWASAFGSSQVANLFWILGCSDSTFRYSYLSISAAWVFVLLKRRVYIDGHVHRRRIHKLLI